MRPNKYGKRKICEKNFVFRWSSGCVLDLVMAEVNELGTFVEGSVRYFSLSSGFIE